MIHTDEARMFSEIIAKKPKAVLIAAPDGLISQAQGTALKIQQKYGVDVFVIADPCYGVCDMNGQDAKRLGVDLAFNIGHTVSHERIGGSTIIIDAYDDVQFDKVLRKALHTLRRYRRIGLCTLSQHLPELERAEKFLQEKGLQTLIGEGGGPLRPGQILGCRFESAYNIRDRVDAFAFLGQSRFHSIGVALATEKPTFMLDPYFQEVVNVEKMARAFQKKAVLAVYKAREAERFGVVVGLREGQAFPEKALKIKKELEKADRKVQLMALREFTAERLALFRDVDAFIQTACPRISIDGLSLNKPILSVPQAEALIKLIRGEELEDFLVRPHWL